MRDDPASGSEATTRDRAEIVALIEEETNAWLRRDLDAWAACCADTDFALRLAARATSGVHVIEGFEGIRANVREVMRRFPDEFLRPADVRRENWIVRVSADMAWASFDQCIAVDSASSIPGRHRQLRILEKLDGAWKIVCNTQIQERLGYHTCPWVRVDEKARLIEMSGSAGEILKRHGALRLEGGRLVGRSRAATASLHDGIETASDCLRDLKTTIRVPVILDDTEDGGLSICWITNYDAMIVVLFDDGRLVENLLTLAAAVFKLTGGQLRVARQIAGGADLGAAAKALGISANTARTHVKRMFDKVGVNNQAALVRAMMSVEAPQLP